MSNHTLEWDLKMMGKAQERAANSTDRSRQVGCIIVGEDSGIIAEGWNTVPNGCDHTEERHQRPAKYAWTEHAERNAIYHAAREGRPTKGATIYVPWYPCADCARAVIQSGIRRIVAFPPNFADPQWGPDFRVVQDMLKEAGVETSLLEGEMPSAS
jgi:dCMP deaminase